MSGIALRGGVLVSINRWSLGMLIGYIALLIVHEVYSLRAYRLCPFGAVVPISGLELISAERIRL